MPPRRTPSGHYLAIIGGVVHAVSVDDGGQVAYRSRSEVVASHLVAFGRSVFALGEGALAYELSPTLDGVRRVDLAGGRRNLTAHSAVDPATGELHLLTSGDAPPQLHVRVSPGGLTRITRPIERAPSRINQVHLTNDAVLFVAEGFVGVMDRPGIDATTTWFARATGSFDILTRQVLGPHGSPDQLLFVPDPDRPDQDDGGWLVGFVHDDTRDETDFVVLDAEAIEQEPIAVARIPRPVPRGAHAIWLDAP